jgi:Protein of unknown function (DUF3263)
MERAARDLARGGPLDGAFDAFDDEPDGAELRIEGVLRRGASRLPQQVPQIPVQAEPDDWADEAESIVDEVLDDEGPGDGPLDVVPALGEREQAILAFERQWWKHAGSKEQAIRDRFQLSPTRYYQALNALLDDPAALAHDPVLVQRLRRLRSSRSRARSARRTDR